MLETIITFVVQAWQYLWPFLLTIGVLVLVHEYGHFWIARRCGVRVEAFSVGFGPEILGWKDRRGTRWRLAILPLGGYVRMFGDSDPSSTTIDMKQLNSLDAAEQSVSFYHKTILARAAIVVAGPVANFLFAIAIFSGQAWMWGEYVRPPVIDVVVPNSAAERAGLRPGDRFLAVNGHLIESFREIQTHFRIHLDEPTLLTIDRGGVTHDIQVSAAFSARDSEYGREHTGVLGVINRQERVLREYQFGEALQHGAARTVDLCGLMLRAISQVATGRRSIDEMGGPIRIAQISERVSKNGFSALLTLMAMLSVSLGLINLLPVPVLDGGHLLFLLVEAGGGRKLVGQLQRFAYPIGFALIGGLMILLTFNDLTLVLRS